MTKEQFNKQKWHKNMMCRVMSRVGVVVGVDFQQSTISIIFEDKQDEVHTYAYHYVTLMEQQRQEQKLIEQKAKELGQKYFPDEYNIWARPNYEAQYVESACKEMVEWAGEHPNNPYKDVIEHMSSNTYRVWKENLWHDAQGEDLPPIDKEVIVLCDDGHGGYKVCFGHRPVESYTGISITNHSEMEEYYPERHGKGGWNIPDVKWWLDCNLPNIEEQK